MKHVAVSTVLVLAFSAYASAQDSLDRLMGQWSEQIRPKAQAARSPRSLQIESADGNIRVIEDGEDGENMLCRLDGAETRSTQVKSKAIVQYMLKCRASRRSLEVRGRLTISDKSGTPPQQFEIEKKFELANDGSLRARSRLRALARGVGAIDLLEESTTFSKNP